MDDAHFGALVARAKNGDASAETELWEMAYEDILSKAHKLMRKERRITLETAALANELYLKVRATGFGASRETYEGFITHLLRQILVDAARKRGAQKRGGGMRRTERDPNELAAPEECAPEASPRGSRGGIWEAIDKALNCLEAESARGKLAVEVFELRMLSRYTPTEIAKLLCEGVDTIDNAWRYAKQRLSNLGLEMFQ